MTPAKKKHVKNVLLDAADCLTQDTVTWRGWYWNLSLMATAGQTGHFPGAKWFGWHPAETRPVSCIR